MIQVKGCLTVSSERMSSLDSSLPSAWKMTDMSSSVAND